MMLATSLVACGNGSATSSPSSVPLDLEQATALSGVLVANLTASGASFTASLDDGSIVLTGDVDWANHTGHALVQARGADAPVVEVFWGEQVVLERRPDLEGTVVAGVTVPGWVARPPAPDTRSLDQLIGVVAALAGSTADNPLLVQQEAGSVAFEDTTVGGVAVHHYRYGTRTHYYLAVDDGRLVRFSGNNADGTRPFTVSFSAFGVRTVHAPDTDDVIDVGALGDAYTPT